MTRLIAFLFVLLAAAPLGAAAPAWPQGDAEQLLAFVDQIGGEGLDPKDYDPAALRRELAAGDVWRLNDRATATFLHVAADLSRGHMRDRRSVGWHIAGPAPDAAPADALLQQALANHAIAPALQSLLPDPDETIRLYSLMALEDMVDKHQNEAVLPLLPDIIALKDDPYDYVKFVATRLEQRLATGTT